MNKCQLHDVDGMAKRVGIWEALWQKKNRLKRIFNRRWSYLLNLFSQTKELSGVQLVERVLSDHLKPGDSVQVLSMEEIKGTLNNWNQFKGCSFMGEMDKYCGTTQKVFKRVEKFLDERDYLMKKSNGIVILEGVYCEGTKDFGPCDRTCFFFWREEWLRKL